MTADKKRSALIGLPPLSEAVANLRDASTKRKEAEAAQEKAYEVWSEACGVSTEAREAYDRAAQILDAVLQSEKAEP